MLGKVGSCAYKEIIVELLKMKFLPVLFLWSRILSTQ